MSIAQKNINEQVLWAMIDRPEARNAIDFDTMDQLDALVSKLEEEDEIRVFILSGAGSRSFVAGGDLKKFHTIQSESKAVEMSRKMHDILNRLESLPCWTIACINGDAYGGGIEMMLSFDFRISVPSARFGFTQGKFYLVPGWGGLTRLTEKVGRTKALEWCAMSKVINAEQALDQGLIEQVIPGKDPEGEMLNWAKPLLLNDRLFIKTLKEGAQRLNPNREAALAAEIEPFAKLWVDDQHNERVQQFMQNGKK